MRKIRLNVDDAELAIGDFLVCGHGPEEADGMPGNGNVGMVAAGHEDGVAIADDRDELGIFGVVVNELNGVGGMRHVDVDIKFFEHFGVFVRGPTGPIAGFGVREANDKAAGFDIFGEEHVEFAMRAGAAGFEAQARIFDDFGVADDLERIFFGDVGGELGEVYGRVGADFDGGVAGNVEGVIFSEMDVFFFDEKMGFTAHANESGFAIAVGKLGGTLVDVQDDTAVSKMTHRTIIGKYGDVASQVSVGFSED